MYSPENRSPSPQQLEPTIVELETIQWTDFLLDDKGKVIGVSGVEWKNFSSKQLRTICSRLALKGVKNVKKSDMVERLVACYENKQAYHKLQGRERKKDKAPRQQIHCSFRLINVLFSDKFAGDFANLGNVASRAVLDSGKAQNDQLFWEKVHLEFIKTSKDYNTLQFQEDGILSQQLHIDPSTIVAHDWKKLRSIWKSVNSDYKAALTRFTQSGTHDSNFYNFCNGKLDIYYLRKYLELKPGLNQTVEAGLPKECAISSDMMIDSSVSAGSTSASKRKRGGNEVAEAIREFSNSAMRSELAKQKLFYMEQENNRRDGEETRQKHKVLFEEWEKIQVHLRSLRQDLLDNRLDEATKAELEDDINGLVQRKNKLAIELGLK